MATAAQRVWRAACPQCGAPVEFASAASASAVCSFCRSTLLREGDALRRIGVSAELFDDHSPLQLGASGSRQGLAFTVVGRLQYGYDGGTWNEWHLLFDIGDGGNSGNSGDHAGEAGEAGEAAVRSAWLSEDNGAYVLAFDAPLPADAPADALALARLRAGQRVVVDGRGWEVASVVQARLLSAQGELPAPPRLDGEFDVVDLRNAAGEVATLDASDPLRLHWSTGRSVALSELRMAGLKEGASEATLAGRAIACPNCGNALAPKLASTKSLSCDQCNAVVDISQGLGAELQHYAQNNSGVDGKNQGQGQGPQIPLGSTGTLALGGPGAAPLPWQVVGYQERCDIPDDADEDTSFWREYLLYNRSEGFAFLVDSSEGWSAVKPLTGAPRVRGDTAEWQGVTYRQRYRYAAKVTWVQGEFYWRVQRDERALVTDYEGTGAAAARRLSREQTGSEVTWSAGETLPAATVAAAFGLAPGARAALERDVPVLSAGKSSLGAGKGIVLFVLVVLAMMLLSRCDDDCDEVRQTFGAASTEYRQCLDRRASGGAGRVGGGSFGGWSSGGSHK